MTDGIAQSHVRLASLFIAAIFMRISLPKRREEYCFVRRFVERRLSPGALFDKSK